MAFDTNHLIAQLKESGLTQRAFCEKNEIPVSTLAYHLRKQKNAQTGSDQKTPFQDQFIPVSLTGNSGPNGPCSIIIVNGTFSLESLSALIRSASR